MVNDYFIATQWHCKAVRLAQRPFEHKGHWNQSFLLLPPVQWLNEEKKNCREWQDKNSCSYWRAWPEEKTSFRHCLEKGMTLEIYLHVLVEDQIYLRLLFCIFPLEKKICFPN